MASSCRFVQSIANHSNDVTSVDLCKSMLATGSNDKLIRLYNCDYANLQFEEIENSPLVGHSYGISRVRFSPCEQFLASCSRDGKTILWKMEDYTIGHIFCHEDQGWIRAIVFSGVGNYLATAGDSPDVRVWSYSTLASIKSLATEVTVTTLIFSTDGEFLVSGDLDGRLKSWSAKTIHIKPICTMVEAHDLGVFNCDITKNDLSDEENADILVTCGNDDLVRTWKVVEGEISPLCKLSGHTSFVNECCFVSQTLIVSVGCDRKLHFWNQGTGTSVLVFPSRQKTLLCCASSGSFLATGSNDRTLSVWQLNLPGILNTSHSLNFTEKDVNFWSSQDVLLWCDDIYPQFSSLFFENGIDGRKLSSLTHKDLLNIGITDPEDQTEVLASICGLTLSSNSLSLEIDCNNDDIPHEYLCPITREIMVDPVVAADGYTYERHAILSWLKSGNLRSPRSNEVLPDDHLVPNKTLKIIIQNYLSTQN